MPIGQNKTLDLYQRIANLESALGLSPISPTGLIAESFADNLTAFAGGGQSGALALTSEINRVTTVATAGDSIKLPVSVAGEQIMVINSGANPIQVFGASGETINGVASATGISQGINTSAVYVCTTPGNWLVPIPMLWSTTPQAVGSASFAIPPHSCHTYVFNRAGVVAATLAAPTAAVDDGNEIVITSDSANAHTLTATGLLDTGSANVNVATFAAQKGAGLSLMAFNGRWKVTAAVGITFS